MHSPLTSMHARHCHPSLSPGRASYLASAQLLVPTGKPRRIAQSRAALSAKPAAVSGLLTAAMAAWHFYLEVLKAAPQPMYNTGLQHTCPGTGR